MPASLSMQVKDELAAVEIERPSVKAIQVAVVIRFAGDLHTDSSRTIGDADLDRRRVADRLRYDIAAVYRYPTQLVIKRPDSATRSGHHVVRVTGHGAELARRSAVIDRRGRPVRGLPPRVVGGSVDRWKASKRCGGQRSWPREQCPTPADQV